MEPQDPEERVAELERQLSEAKATAWRAERGVGDNTAFLNDSAQEQYSQATPFGTALATAPRKVPFRFLLAESLPFRWWYLFALFMVAIPPIALWIMLPALLLPAAILALLVIYGMQFRGAMTRVALLKWGQPATVTGSEVKSEGTYYSGTTYSNVMLPVAHGWTVTRPLWSGPKTKTRIRYLLDGYQGELTVGGREYIDGVVLADQRNPRRALCVTAFPYDLDRDESGNWTGRLRVRLQIGMVCWLLVVIGWVAMAVLVSSRSEAGDSSGLATTPGQTRSAPLTPPRGEAVIVNGANEIQSITCDLNDVTVNGTDNRVDITGHCRNLTVLGRGNRVSVDVADAITANGIDNVVTFRVGSPQIHRSGSSNVEPG